ncbi:MAG: phosphate ABC transporter permease family protein, partial [Gammaproteobacteria bacterium]|nr:phosphate ABC transporter permease family protein [Gammaproteobacteria bacterium]
MNSFFILLTAISLTLMSGFFGWRRVKNIQNLRSRPVYHGLNHGLKVALPMLMVASLWLISDNLIIKPAVMSDLTHNNQVALEDPDFHYLQIVQIANGLIAEKKLDTTVNRAVEDYRVTKQNTDNAIFWMMVIAAVLGFRNVAKRFHPQMPAREQVERIVKFLLAASSGVAVLTTAGIVLALLFETLRFFHHVPFTEFLFGTHWSPQMAIRADQVGSSGAFGALPLFAGTLLIAIIAMMVAVPVGLYSAIYLSEYAQPKIRAFAKPALEILAGIPTVVYGFFAALTVAPMIVELGEYFAISASSESALAAGLVMGVMIIPFVSSLS